MEPEYKDWVQEEFATLSLGDERLNKRAQTFLSRLADKPMLSIPAACKGWAETKAAYRLLNSDKVTTQGILAPHIEATLKRVEQAPIVLCIEDTSEIDYTTKSDISGLGPLNYENRHGFYAHPMIAVTPDRLCHGVLAYQHIIREQGSLGKKKSATRSIEDKETMRWLDGYRRVCELAKNQPETQWVYVADRESDIYEIFAEHAAQGEGEPGFVVRSKHDRLLQDGTKLSQTLEDSPVLGEVVFEIPDSQRNNKRQVTQTLQSAKVLLKGPHRQAGVLGDVEINVVLAKEKDPPPGEDPIMWILLTNKEITTNEQASEILQWYLCRWQIEIYFKVLKSGCKVEQLQLEDISRLEAAFAFYMIVAWRVLYLTMLGRSCPELPCDVVFETEEWQAAISSAKRKHRPKTHHHSTS